MGGEVADALAATRPDLVDRLILIDSPAEKSVEFDPLTEAYLTPVIGELLSHLMTDKAIREGLAQGFAPGFPVPDRFVADVRQLTYTAFKSAHNDSVAYQGAKPAYQRLGRANSSSAVARHLRSRRPPSAGGNREALREGAERAGRLCRRRRPFADGREAGADA